MKNWQRDHPEAFAWLVSWRDPQTPMERLEATEWAEDLLSQVADGQVIVLHGRKTQGYSQLYILDKMKWLNGGQ